MKEMLKLLPYIKQYKGMFTGGILLMICMVGFELAGPLIAAAIIDNHIKLGEGNILIRPILYLVALFLTIKMMLNGCPLMIYFSHFLLLVYLILFAFLLVVFAYHQVPFAYHLMFVADFLFVLLVFAPLVDFVHHLFD